MDIIEILSIIIALANFIIGFIVLLKREKKPAIAMYSISVFCIGAWVLATVFYNLAFFLEPIVWLKIIYFISYLMSISQSLFAYLFPQKIKDSFWKYFSIIIITLIPSAYLLFFSDLVILGVIHNEENYISIAQMGKGYWVYIVPNVLALIIMSTYFLKKASLFRGYEKAQIRLYVLGAVLMYTPIVILDYFLPLLTGDTKYYKYGPVFVMFYTILVGYSIVKRRFLGIKNLLSQIIYYTITFITITIFFYLTTFFVNKIFINIYSSQALIFTFISLSFLVVIFSWIGTHFKEYIERKITYTKFNPDETLKRFSKILSAELDIDRVTENIIGLIKMTLELESIGVIIFKKDDNNKSLVISKNMSQMYIFSELQFLNLIEKISFNYKKNIYIYNDMNILIEENTEYKKELMELKKSMKRDSIKEIIYFGEKRSCRGLIFLGERMYDEPLSIQEINYMYKVSDLLSIAVERAVLYKDVQSFNISLRKKVNEATSKIQKQLIDLQEAREKERDMIDIMGHELRTPATIINMNVGLLDRLWRNIQQHVKIDQNKKEEIAKTYSKYLDRINDGIQREMKLINVLLASAKLDGGKIVLNREKLDISKIIETSIHAHEREAKTKNLTIRYINAEDLANIEREISEEDQEKYGEFGLPYVFADKVRLFEIIDNFVSNAVKYTEKGGVTVSVEELKDDLKISIKDTGIGISEKDIKRLGEKFYRAGQYIERNGDLVVEKESSDTVEEKNNNHKKSSPAIVRPGGTGLGLFVAFGLIKEHEGKVSINSTVGLGSEFAFTIKKYRKGMEKDYQTQKSGSKDVFVRMGITKKDSFKNTTEKA